uniref:Ig-like domain-containing protein n=1 Tax=Periophthalmus magnuspinnatus TaxID=409849 RepID=A0A3B4AH17_9GOBI
KMEVLLFWILYWCQYLTVSDGVDTRSNPLSLSVPGQDFAVEPVRFLYPVLGQDQTMDCDCDSFHCEQVTWFRTLTTEGVIQVLGRSNQADRVSYESGMEKKFQILKKAGSGYSLRIRNTSTADRGVYSCVLKTHRTEELWKRGVLLLPGESPVTEPSKEAPRPPPVPLHCSCQTHSHSTGCGSLILWPLVGVASTLCLTLLCTVYYYYSEYC